MCVVFAEVVQKQLLCTVDACTRVVGLSIVLTTWAERSPYDRDKG